MDRTKQLHPVIEEGPKTDEPVNNISSAKITESPIKITTIDKEKAVEEEEEEEQKYDIMRAGFIIKVYGIISIQLTITLICIGCVYIPGYILLLLSKPGLILLYTSMVLSIVLAIILTCAKRVARKVPCNYILLLIFTLCESYMLQFICAAFEPLSVLIAGVLTIVMVVTLSLYALKSKANFTCFGALFFTFLINLLFSSILILLMRSRWLQIIYSSFGVVLFSLYIICDVQMISGNFGKSFEIDDYIIAAICIYLDIINLFIQILHLIGTRRK